MFTKFRTPIIACVAANLICLAAIVASQGEFSGGVTLAMMFSILVLLISLVHYIVLWIWKEFKDETIGLASIFGIPLMLFVQIPTLYAYLLFMVVVGR